MVMAGARTAIRPGELQPAQTRDHECAARDGAVWTALEELRSQLVQVMETVRRLDMRLDPVCSEAKKPNEGQLAQAGHDVEMRLDLAKSLKALASFAARVNAELSDVLERLEA